MTIRCILQPFGIFFSHFGMLYREKSGNPGSVGSQTLPIIRLLLLLQKTTKQDVDETRVARFFFGLHTKTEKYTK
jgi:hypothetical protein